MAVGKAFTAVDMRGWDYVDSDNVVINGSNDTITESGGGEVAHYFGTFMTVPSDPFFEIIDGTMTGTDRFIDGVRQYNVTGLNADAVTVYNFLVDGTDPVGLLSYLFRGKDALTGSGFADFINGFGGRDTINGRGGADVINGGAGSDKLVWGAGDTLNGGAGKDTLKVTVANLNLTTSANPNNLLKSLEQIDLKAGDHTLKLGKKDVLAMSPTDEIRILGDSGDTVNIAGSQVEGGVAPLGFTRYTIGSATLIIDSDISVF